MGLASLTGYGVDYVTAYTRSEYAAKQALDAWEQYRDAMVQSGHDVVPASVEGFRGYTCAKVFVGERHDGFLTRATSFAADAWIPALQSPTWRASRVDVQLTAEGGPLTDDYAERTADNFNVARTSGGRGRPLSVRLEKSYGAGDTAYVGSVYSDAFARIYDKHRESRGEYPAGSWRFEVQYKHGQAAAALDHIREHQDRLQAVTGLVRGWLEPRGVDVPIEVPDVLHEIHLGKLTPDVERRLNWLRKFVAPTVRWLIARGKYADVLEALELVQHGPY